MRGLIAGVLAASSAALAPHVGFAAAEPTPAFVREADIAAPDGRWDYANWDAGHGRLLVAHGTDVLVIVPGGDANAKPVVRAIGTIVGAHAALAIPGGNRILVTSGRDNTVRILDAESGEQLSSIAVPANPDAALIGPDGNTAYVMAAKAGIASIIDLKAMREVRQIALKPGLEMPLLVNTHLLAVNNEDANEIELADPVAGKPLGTIALPGCEGPTGLAYAPADGLALASCANGQAALVDLAARKLVQRVPIGAGPDAVIWDAVRHRFLIPSGKTGTLAVITLDHGKARVVATIPTEPSARTAALDPVSGHLYSPAARFLPAEPGKRAEIAQGSFHLVVLKAAG
ncbi:YncE family protein [Novosphingobium sp.]|uniref:YncE family protein n=1 Tax=Novosphingobium sp. TaxID=1874826 RepID=UPI0038B876EA